jgi:hypothetical protein
VLKHNSTTLNPGILFEYLFVHILLLLYGVWLDLSLSPNLAYDLHVIIAAAHCNLAVVALIKIANCCVWKDIGWLSVIVAFG